MLEISAERITIDLRKIIHKDYSVHYLPILEDQLTLYYTGQELCFCAVDGDNVKLPALVEWIKSIQYAFVIPNDNICFISVSPSLPQWRWIPFYLEAFEHVVNLLECYNIDIELNQAKFVGVLAASRWSPVRMRMCYELDKAFPDDAFITYKMSKDQLILVEQHYQKEIEWANNRKFNNDILSGNNAIDFRDAVREYTKIWNQFQIEIICETDEYQNQWFTDKTAKCLSTGKPFLLLSGQHSLQNLRHLGFFTFDQWIDESYDQCVLPGQRINAIINSLQKLYLSPKKPLMICQMYKHAKQNIDAYHKYVQSQIQLRTHT